MRLELLKSLVRIDARIEIVEADHKSNRNAAVGHVVNKSTAELFIAQGESHRVNHAAADRLLGGNVPDFLYARGVHLWIFACIEFEFLSQLLRQRSAGSFGKDGDFGAYIDAGLVVAFRLPRFINI